MRRYCTHIHYFSGFLSQILVMLGYLLQFDYLLIWLESI
ncbi:hypothetical protein GV51_0423 [Gardnerella vaginalis 5-1]|nr:hypothetical protein GV51_0423 [Gardnerella vaginalis 5-1]